MVPSHGYCNKSGTASTRWEEVAVKEVLVAALVRLLWPHTFYLSFTIVTMSAVFS